MSFSGRVAAGAAVGILPAVEAGAYCNLPQVNAPISDQAKVVFGFPVAGAAIGAAIHGARLLRNAPPAVQGAFAAITAGGIAVGVISR